MISLCFRVMLIVSPAFWITLTVAMIEGIVAYAYYVNVRCDPLESGQIHNPNQIIPYMVMDIFRGFPGMPGLFLAALFSASLRCLTKDERILPIRWHLSQTHAKASQLRSYLWLSVLGIAFVLIVGFFVSWATGFNRDGSLDPRYVIFLSDVLRNMLNCWKKTKIDEKAVTQDSTYKTVIGIETGPTAETELPLLATSGKDRSASDVPSHTKKDET
ncbi:uncharacterized protein [Haliotis cracherodii]|uniref:uncharacterized protein n=1 Tax=Haliotis cracherodii TaxID=6455 RepID=UPI0039E904F5